MLYVLVGMHMPYIIYTLNAVLNTSRSASMKAPSFLQHLVLLISFKRSFIFFFLEPLLHHVSNGPNISAYSSHFRLLPQEQNYKNKKHKVFLFLEWTDTTGISSEILLSHKCYLFLLLIALQSRHPLVLSHPHHKGNFKIMKMMLCNR